MLGTALQTVLAGAGVRFSAPPEAAFDITDANVVASVVDAFAHANPGALLVNAAAYTNVERAEDDTETAYRVNELGARLLAEAARDSGLGFAHVSTDFVFDGTKAGGYVETDPVNPLSVYGASKLAGERAVAGASPEALIVRTAWVFGAAGENFPVKILRAAREGRPLRVVTDETGSPTYTLDLAAGLLALAGAGVSGVYHLTGSGRCTRYELATEVLSVAGIHVPVEPVVAATFPTRATRPANSVLDCGKAAALGVVLPDWRDAVHRFVESGDADAGR
jgi:dTDP-4-dehydrorhamnose reductase